MEGSRRGRKPPWNVEREFASSRLEGQILSRVYELVLPVIRCRLGGHSPVAEVAAQGAAESASGEVRKPVTKGA
jgi:hypothetical protein